MTNTNNKRPSLRAALARMSRTFLRKVCDPYRPELHYMRGPGPKWHARHGMAEQAAVLALPRVRPDRRHRAPVSRDQDVGVVIAFRARSLHAGQIG